MVRRLVHDEQGVAIVIALITMLTLSILTGAAAIIVSVNQHESQNSSDARHAFAIAESCLAYAEGNLYGIAANAASHASSPETPNESATACNVDSGDPKASGSYWSSPAGDGVTWTMWGQGIYNGTTRTVHAQTNVPSPVTVNETGVWNYLYSNQVSGTSSTNCDTSIGGSTIVSVPTFVRGNLCLQSKFTGSQLGVGGNLTLTSQGSNHGGIGSASTPISQLSVVGSCNGVTTGTSTCNGKTSPIYATNVSGSLPISPLLPTLDLTSMYNNANPGPAAGHGCQVGSGAPTNLFDNNTTLDNSNGTINLFPSTDYDCVNGSNELKWCATVNATYGCTTANTMVVNGEFYFDGSLNVSGNNHVIYSGLGTLYFTGTISTSGNFSLCAVSSCNATWDTSQAELVLLAGCWANSTGSSLVQTSCVNYGGTNIMQVGTYCTTDYRIAGTATNWGPVLANTLNLNGNLSELVPFKVMPPGTPTNTSTSYLPASQPTYWSG